MMGDGSVLGTYYYRTNTHGARCYLLMMGIDIFVRHNIAD